MTLWPRYSSPDDVVEIESTPLSERGLPASTYELLCRAARLWPDRTAAAILRNTDRWQEPVKLTFAELLADERGDDGHSALVRDGLGNLGPVFSGRVIEDNLRSPPAAVLNFDLRCIVRNDDHGRAAHDAGGGSDCGGVIAG
jgi:hypothetical protein